MNDLDANERALLSAMKDGAHRGCAAITAAMGLPTRLDTLKITGRLVRCGLMLQTEKPGALLPWFQITESGRKAVRE